jgi:hypothetical protein
MKRILLLTALLLLMVLSSCRKDHTCTCTYNNPGVGITPQLTAWSDSKDAKNWCAAYQTQQNSNGVSGWTCTVN